MTVERQATVHEQGHIFLVSSYALKFPKYHGSENVSFR